MRSKWKENWDEKEDKKQGSPAHKILWLWSLSNLPLEFSNACHNASQDLFVGFWLIRGFQRQCLCNVASPRHLGMRPRRNGQWFTARFCHRQHAIHTLFFWSSELSLLLGMYTGEKGHEHKNTKKIWRQNKTTITNKINSKGLRVRFCNIQYTLLCKLSGAKRARRKEWIRSSFSITLNLGAAGKSPSGGKIKSSYSTTDTVA